MLWINAHPNKDTDFGREKGLGSSKPCPEREFREQKGEWFTKKLLAGTGLLLQPLQLLLA